MISGPTVGKTVTLSANAWPLRRGTIKMVKICIAGQDCTGAKAHYITVEARIRKKDFETGEPGNGVLVQDFQLNRIILPKGCILNKQDPLWVMPVDATPGDYDSSKCSSGGRRWPGYALGNAEFVVGKTYINRTYGLSMLVVSGDAASFTVKITRS